MVMLWTLLLLSLAGTAISLDYEPHFGQTQNYRGGDQDTLVRNIEHDHKPEQRRSLLDEEEEEAEEEVELEAAEVTLKDKRLIFVAGPHHSGTTLMSLLISTHPRASGLVDTGQPQDEGQHLQNIYPKAYNLGGMLGYAHKLHLTENSPKCNPANAAKLLTSWRPYWNMSKDLLVEKTPNHMVMTRFLQCLFTPEKTTFVITMRHPFGATYFKWKLPLNVDEMEKTGCLEKYVVHWLAQMDSLKEDLSYIQNINLVMFENFTSGNIQDNYNRLLSNMKLPPTTTKVKTAPRSPRVVQTKEELEAIKTRVGKKALKRRQRKKASDTKKSNGRKLLGYRQAASNRTDKGVTARDIVVHTEPWMNWIVAWESRWGKYGTSDHCADVFDKYEERVNAYGYSLKDPTLVTMPPALKEHVVVPY